MTCQLVHTSIGHTRPGAGSAALSHTLDVRQVPAGKVQLQLEVVDLQDAQRRAGAASALVVQVFVASEAEGRTVAARLNDIGDCCAPSLALSRDRAAPHAASPPLARQRAGIADVGVVCDKPQGVNCLAEQQGLVCLCG